MMKELCHSPLASQTKRRYVVKRLLVYNLLAVLAVLPSVTSAVDVHVRDQVDQAVEQRTREWLARNSYAANWSRHVKRPVEDWESWIEDGKKIPGVEAVLRAFLKDHDASVELPQVVRCLGEIGTHDSIPALIACLDDGSMHVRLQAALALGKLQDERALKSLGSRLVVEVDHNVRANIVVALAKYSGPEAGRYLSVATKDESEFVAAIAKAVMTKRRLDTQK